MQAEYYAGVAHVSKPKFDVNKVGKPMLVFQVSVQVDDCPSLAADISQVMLHPVELNIRSRQYDFPRMEEVGAEVEEALTG